MSNACPIDRHAGVASALARTVSNLSHIGADASIRSAIVTVWYSGAKLGSALPFRLRHPGKPSPEPPALPSEQRHRAWQRPSRRINMILPRLEISARLGCLGPFKIPTRQHRGTGFSAMPAETDQIWHRLHNARPVST